MAELVVYPEIDGDVIHAQADQSWATIRGGAGTSASSDANDRIVELLSQNYGTNWFRMARGIFVFDISSFSGDKTNITDNTFSVYGNVKGDTGEFPITLNVYSSSPASTSSLAAGDYDSLGTTAYSSGIAYADLSTVGYNNLSFNATGDTAIDNAIDGDGIVKLGTRDATYDAANSEPASSSGSEEYSWFNAFLSAQTGTDNDPKLVITYSVAVEETAAYTAVPLNITVPSITATYVLALTSAITALSLVATVPSVTATGDIAKTASYDPLSLVITQPNVTSTYESELSASFTALSLLITNPNTTATYQSELSASFTALSLSATIPNITALLEIKPIALYSALSFLVSVPDMTATSINVNYYSKIAKPTEGFSKVAKPTEGWSKVAKPTEGWSKVEKVI